MKLLRDAGDFVAAQEKIQEKFAEQTGAQGDALQDVRMRTTCWEM